MLASIPTLRGRPGHPEFSWWMTWKRASGRGPVAQGGRSRRLIRRRSATLEGVRRLSPQAVEQLAQIAAFVEDRDDDADIDHG